MPYALLILLALTFSAQALSQVQGLENEAKLQELAGSRYWHLLLHTRPRLLTGFKSQISDSAFFLAPDGRTSPLSELKATLKLFATDKKTGRYLQSPQCAFPERFRYLKVALNLTYPPDDCKDLKAWLEGFSGESATLVYSAAYPNNPASIFGHTLLRINSKKKHLSTARQDLLDYSVSYAAAVHDESPLEFALRGLFGGFEGVVGVQPYYMKVNEYVSAENRDLWEYDLNVRPEQIDHLLRHVWELQNSAFINYYFIDENCAYVLLLLLEIANPDWNFIDHVPWYLSPAESVKIVYETPGAVSDVHFRPSSFKLMQYRLAQLDEKQLQTLSKLMDRQSLARSGPVDSPMIIDAALDDLQYLRAEHSGKQNPEEKTFYRELLLARAKMPETDSDEEINPKLKQDSRPDQSHDTMQLGTSFGAVNTQPAEELHLRMGLSDFINDDTGLTPHSSMRWLEAQARYIANPGRLVFEDLEILQVRSLFPRNQLHQDFSWGINFDFLTPHDLGCEDCKAMHAEGSGGFAWNLGQHLTVASFLTGNLEGSTVLPHHFRLGPSLDLEAIYKFSSRFVSHLLVRTFIYTDFGGADFNRNLYYDLLWEHAWTLSQKWDLRVKVRVIPGDLTSPSYAESWGGINFYFD